VRSDALSLSGATHAGVEKGGRARGCLVQEMQLQYVRGRRPGGPASPYPVRSADGYMYPTQAK
jgi:hypothetical protein